MRYFEQLQELLSILRSIDYKSSFESSTAQGNLNYKIANLNELRINLLKLEKLDLPENVLGYISTIKSTPIFQTNYDTINVSSSDDTKIKDNINYLKVALATMINSNKKVVEKSSEDVIFIGLPEIDDFNELSKVSNELRKSIEIPVNDSNSDGHVKIVTAESGSIWLIISAGTVAAVNLIGAICWAGAVLRRKNVELKMFEEQARTLKLKNDALEHITEVTKAQYTNILNDEAEAIASKHYSNKDPETIERLKLSLNTMSDLIDKGAKFLPASQDDKITELFPNLSKMDLIESAIKRIGESINPN